MYLSLSTSVKTRMQSRLAAQCCTYLLSKEATEYAHSTKNINTRQQHCTHIANKLHTELKLHTEQNHYTR
jgi:hypothetical protein